MRWQSSAVASFAIIACPSAVGRNAPPVATPERSRDAETGFGRDSCGGRWLMARTTVVHRSEEPRAGAIGLELIWGERQEREEGGPLAQPPACRTRHA